MADIDRAIAHADELLAEYDRTAGIPSKYAAGLRRLRNALDAARGEAVWQARLTTGTWLDLDGLCDALSEQEQGAEVRALYAAPPAAAVPVAWAAAADWLERESTAVHGVCLTHHAEAANWLREAQQPAAAVPAEPAPNPESADFKAGMALGRAESEFLAAAIKNPACVLCGATCEKDAETKCRPSGDSCPGTEWPLANLWALAQQPAAAVPALLNTAETSA